LSIAPRCHVGEEFENGTGTPANTVMTIATLPRLTTTAIPIDYEAHDAINELSRQHSKPEILRCLKRYIAREIFKILRAVQPAQSPPHFA
jgi:hypothetical protein